MQGLISRKGGVMPAPRKYPNELRERAQRLVAEAMVEDPGLSLNQAVIRIGPKGRGRARHVAGLDQALGYRCRPAAEDDDR